MARAVGRRWTLVGKDAAVFRCTYTSICLCCECVDRSTLTVVYRVDMYSTLYYTCGFNTPICTHTAPVLLLAVFLPEGTCTCPSCPEVLQQCSSRECFMCDHVPASCDIDEDNRTISCTADTQSCYYQTCDECDHCALLFLQFEGTWTFRSLCVSHRCVNFHEDADTVCQRRLTYEACRFRRNDRNEGFPPSQFLCSCYGENCSSPLFPYVYTHPPSPPSPSPPPSSDASFNPTSSNTPLGSPHGSPIVSVPRGKSSHVHFTCHPHVHIVCTRYVHILFVYYIHVRSIGTPTLPL